MGISALSVFACLWPAAMAALVGRQDPNNPFNQLPKAPPAGTPTPSLVETVILIPPSGTVGGSILVTDIPANVPFTFRPPPQPTPSFVDTVILIPPSGTVGGSILITTVPISRPSISTTSPSTSRSTSITSSSSRSSSSTSSSTTSSLSSTTSTTSTLLSARPTATPLGSTSQKSTLSGGKIAGITIGVAAFALIFAIIAYILLRRRKRAPTPDSQVYPEEAYLYDPPMSVATSSAAGLSQHPVNSEAVFAGAAPVGMHSRSATPPNIPATEREGLLSGSEGAAGPGPSSSSYPGRRWAYAPAPTAEMDGGESGNPRDPFADQLPAEYEPGDDAAPLERTSMQSTPGRSGEVISPQMRAVRQAWGWE